MQFAGEKRGSSSIRACCVIFYYMDMAGLKFSVSSKTSSSVHDLFVLEHNCSERRNQDTRRGIGKTTNIGNHEKPGIENLILFLIFNCFSAARNDLNLFFELVNVYMGMWELSLFFPVLLIGMLALNFSI